jgi:tetratricopeptide (TPR) repeat protein
MNRETKIFYAAYIAFILLFALRLIPFLFPDSRLWGINHLIFLPTDFSIIFFALAAIILALPWIPSLRVLGERLTDIFNRIFFESSKRIYYRLIAVAVCGLLFALLPAKTFFLGDGYASLDNLASQTGTYIKWSERGIVYIQHAIQSFYGAKSLATSLATFRTISVLSGIIAVWFFFLISGIISDDKLKRLATFSVSLFSGVLLLFFGYVENYPMLWIAYPAFIYFSLRHLKNQEGLLWVGLSLLFGLSVHFLSAVFIPAFIYLIFCQGKGLKLYNRRRNYFWIAGISLVVLFTILFFRKLSGDIYFQNIFLPPFDGKPLDPGYYLFSPSHIIDILNIFLLLSPGILILLILASGNFRRIFGRKDAIYLSLCSLGVFGFLFIIDPTLGLGRDWDLFSLSAYSFTLLLIILIGSSGLKSLLRLNISFILLLIISCVPYLLTNLNEKHAQAYIEYLADLDPKKSLGSVLSLHRYYLDKGDSTAVISLIDRHRLIYDLESKYEQALRFLDMGQVEKARPFINAIPPDKYSARYHNLMSLMAYHSMDDNRAMEESNRAIQLQKYNAMYYLRRGIMHISMQENDSAIYYFQKAYRLDSDDQIILEGLARQNLVLRNPDSTLSYIDKLEAINPRQVSIYYYRGIAYAMKGMLPDLKHCYNKYIETAAIDQLYEQRKEELYGYITSLENLKK